MNKKELIRIIYIYIFSLVGLVLLVIGSVRLVNIALQTYVFTKADQSVVYPYYRPIIPEEEKLTEEERKEQQEEQLRHEKEERQSRRQRTASESLAMIIIGTPLFLYHWQLAKKDREKEKE